MDSFSRTETVVLALVLWLVICVALVTIPQEPWAGAMLLALLLPLAIGWAGRTETVAGRLLLAFCGASLLYIGAAAALWVHWSLSLAALSIGAFGVGYVVRTVWVLLMLVSLPLALIAGLFVLLFGSGDPQTDPGAGLGLGFMLILLLAADLIASFFASIGVLVRGFRHESAQPLA